jgi:hypothetical protein
MLDVHPAHHAASSWRDFFIHIITIVLGLLIAIGLEQTVEWLHHRHGMELAREHIRAEVEVNQRIRGSDKQQVDLVVARMQHNLDTLHALKTKSDVTPGGLDFTWNVQGFYTAAYNSAHESGALSLMPYDESAMYSDAYLQASATNDALFETVKKIYAAEAVLHDRPLDNLTLGELQSLSNATSAALGAAKYFAADIDISQNEWDAILSGHFRNDIGGTGK